MIMWNYVVDKGINLVIKLTKSTTKANNITSYQLVGTYILYTGNTYTRNAHVQHMREVHPHSTVHLPSIGRKAEDADTMAVGPENGQ